MARFPFGSLGASSPDDSWLALCRQRASLVIGVFSLLEHLKQSPSGELGLRGLVDRLGGCQTILRTVRFVGLLHGLLLVDEAFLGKTINFQLIIIIIKPYLVTSNGERLIV